MMYTFNLLDVLALFLTVITVVTAVPSTTGNEQDDLKELSSALADAGISPARIASVESGSLVGANLHHPGFVGCAAACNVLASVLPDATSQQGSSSYIQQEASYWSNQQAEVQPVCRVQPRSPQDVSVSLIVAKIFECPFAVKGGGHAAFTGASNIHGGLTMDLAYLNQVQVSTDRTLTQVGAGNHWVDVYSQLDPLGLSVIGGRVAAVGVGGLTLGGGISFFSGRHGWAFDNVRNYQVVLANTSIVNINPSSSPDLYFALRGGGNNFGIVTRFDLETFPQGNMWGGTRIYPFTANTSLLTAFIDFTTAAPSDPDAALILAFAYFEGEFFISADLEHAHPVKNPAIFDDFMEIESLSDTLRITNLTDLTLELNAINPGGLRETYFTATFKPNAALFNTILELFTKEVAGLKDAAGILPALVIQPVTTDMISHFGRNGGNALGIEEGDGPLLLMSLAIMWSSPTDDARIAAAANRIIDASIAAAKPSNLANRYIYQNYAAASQDVFNGYGAVNQQRLREISRAYDPEGVFQRLWPGGFKLGG